MTRSRGSSDVKGSWNIIWTAPPEPARSGRSSAKLPLLTRYGGAFQGRVAASLLRSIGLPELVTRDLQEYETLALRLARDPNLLKSYRTRLAERRLTAPLFDTARTTRHIEAAYEKMQALKENGEAPQSFAVSKS